ncbi:MAG: fibrillin [Cyanobacteria bacterium M5B4]|nr:MAG: fibrillin [Cyanobacteria bacterium M5B4]
MSKKEELLTALTPLQRGLKVNQDQLQTVMAIITELEKLNPNTSPTTVPHILDGNWQMLFTTSKSILGFDRLPLTTLGGIYQYIDTDRGKVYNIAELQSLPLLSSVVSVVADLTIVSAQRVAVKFTRSVVGFQSLLQYKTPEQLIAQLSTGTRLFALDTPINGRTDAWVDITYLDENLRITRGNEGNVFVLKK